MASKLESVIILSGFSDQVEYTAWLADELCACARGCALLP